MYFNYNNEIESKFGIQGMKEVYFVDNEVFTENLKEYWYNVAGLGLIELLSFVSAIILIVLGFKKDWFKFKQFKLNQITEWHFITNWKFPFGYRIVVLCFCILVWCWTWFYQTDYKSEGNLYDFLSWYTVWNFTLLIIYFLLTTIMTFVVRYESIKALRYFPIISFLIGNFTEVIFNVEVALVFLVDTITWGVLFPLLLISNGNIYTLVNVTSFVMHGINIIFMIIELGLNKIPIRIIHMTWMVLWGASYVIWAMIFYLITGHWRYPFLNLWVWYAMICYLAVFGLHFVYYILVFGLYNLKLKYLKHKFGVSYVNDLTHPPGHLSANLSVEDYVEERDAEYFF